MKAIVFDQFGPTNQLHEADVPTPEPKENEVQIRLMYSGVNPVDDKIRQGLFKDMMRHDFPVIPGWEGVGEISKLGKNANKFKLGDKVWAYCRKEAIGDGTYAEFICVPESYVALAPKTINLMRAAAFPLVALTAWQALFDFAHLKAGQKILILRGAGGTGSVAIQLAKLTRADIAATCSDKNLSYVKSLGASLAIDYNHDDVPQKIREFAPDGLDVVLDLLGPPQHREAMRWLKKGGCYVSIVDRDIAKEAPRDIKAGFVFVSPNSEQLQKLAQLIDQKMIRPPEVRELDLHQAAEAQELVHAGHVRGKLVLKIR